jgi:3-hexulose-6-phosphate synthase
MRLQLAIDLVDKAKAFALLEQVVDLIDIVEIGTPLILQEGMSIVTEIKRRYPASQVLADLKIVDAGELEARIAFDAGADIVTVLALAHDVTIQSALEQARKCGKAIMADLISVTDVKRRVSELETIGVESICVHTAYDMQSLGDRPLESLRQARSVRKKARLAVAGGIKPDILAEIKSLQPDTVIVGSYITNHKDSRMAALKIRELL